MAVALVTRSTSVVEHLGVWAYDRVSTAASYSTGRYVPVCGSERNHGPWHPTSHVSHGRDRLLRIKPFCSRCARLLADFNTLTETTP